jgi:hypothetical protein
MGGFESPLLRSNMLCNLESTSRITVADGCAALADLLATAYKNTTVAQMIAKYAPSDDKNDPDKYTKVVCDRAGIEPKVIIRDLEPVKFFDLCKAISRFERWFPGR